MALVLLLELSESLLHHLHPASQFLTLCRSLRVSGLSTSAHHLRFEGYLRFLKRRCCQCVWFSYPSSIFMGGLGRCKNRIINVIFPEFAVLPFGVIFKRLIYSDIQCAIATSP